METKYLFLLINLLIYFTAFPQSTKKYLKPSNHKKAVSTIISGKKRTYYSLDENSASLIRVKGPGVLRVLSRTRFIPSEENKIDYSVIYSIDGAKKEKFEADKVSRSKKATYKNGSLGVPGSLKDFEIELSRGYHSIEFWQDKNSAPVELRFSFTSKKAKKRDWIPYSPSYPSEPVDLITKETNYTYYRFSDDKPLNIEINGPTELRILSRTENQFNMKGRIQYRIQVFENEKIKNTYQLSSKGSQVTTYKIEAALIPGKACEFVITVPKGKHKYKIIPMDKDKKTILGRILIPKKDIKLKK